MIRYCSGYSLIVYLGFLIFVLWNLPSHANPKPFAAMFLTLWPLCYIGAGAEIFIYIKASQNKKYKEEKRRELQHGFKKGMAIGLISINLSILAFWLSQYSLWFFAVIIIVSFFLPGIVFWILTERVINQTLKTKPNKPGDDNSE